MKDNTEEFQDESGLELSLGLGLSSGDTRQKWKASDGPAAPSPPLTDLTSGESPVVRVPNGSHPSGKPKPSSKASGLDAALKKFLEGRLDEQDENSKLLDGSLQKDNEKSAAAGSHGTQKQVDLVSSMGYKGNPFLFQELQVSSGSRGQLPAHTMPLQLVDAFKISPFGTNLGSPHSDEAFSYQDGDDVPGSLEQHRKFSEVQKKRKQSIDEQKHQKKDRKEDTAGFLRSGSNMWLRGLDATDSDKAVLGLTGNDSNEHIQLEISHEKQATGDAQKGYQMGRNESTNFKQNTSTGSRQNDSRATANGVEVSYMPEPNTRDTSKEEPTQADDGAWQLTVIKSHSGVNLQLQGRDDKALKGTPFLPDSQKQGKVSAFGVVGREGEKAGSLQRQREKLPSEISSASTNSTGKMDEKSREGIGEVSSSAPEMKGSYKGPLAASFPPSTPTSGPALPYSLPPYPVVPMPYYLPASVPHAPGMPFQAGLSFPYFMQYMPPASDGQEQNSAQPVVSSAFQLPPGIEYRNPQVSSLEGASWVQALRPPINSPFANANNGALYSTNAMGVLEDRFQAVSKLHDNGGGQNVDTYALGNHPLLRPVLHNVTQKSAIAMPQLHQAPDLPLLASVPIHTTTHFNSQLALEDHGRAHHGEPRSFTGQGGMNSFPEFAASIQAVQNLPGPTRSPANTGAKEDGGHGGKVDVAAVQQGHCRNTIEPSNAGQEEFRRALGVNFHQGTTDNLSVVDGVGEYMAHLQRGIAPGLKFGGTGTPPDLPWVYTTGPNGRTVGGVLYRLSQSQLTVVCACHGKHMSPDEFAQHAGDVDVANAEKNVVVSSPLTRQAT